MKLITYFAISKAKKINDVNEWWCAIINTIYKGNNPNAGDVFEQALRSDGVFNNNIIKLYKNLRNAELPA